MGWNPFQKRSRGEAGTGGGKASGGTKPRRRQEEFSWQESPPGGGETPGQAGTPASEAPAKTPAPAPAPGAPPAAEPAAAEPASTEPAAAEPAAAEPATPRPEPEIREDVIAALRTVYDPEIPINIYEIGLVYGIDIQPSGQVHVRMTLTSPACPVAGTLPGEVEDRVRTVPGVTKATVELVWDPPWGPDKMSEAARLQLNV